VTEKCDVYSFGVVALETMMGKHPGEIISCLTKPSSLNTMLSEILDSRLPQPRILKDIFNVILVVVVAIKCLCPTPKFRPFLIFKNIKIR